MASTGKRKTTMAKLNRERRLLDRRIEKKAKKDARKRAAALDPGGTGDDLIGHERRADRHQRRTDRHRPSLRSGGHAGAAHHTESASRQTNSYAALAPATAVTPAGS